MSQSHELQLHIGKLGEIRSILTAMKNLALIETHKLARFQALQSQAVAAVELAASDLLSFYPQLAETGHQALSVCIMVGSERGFCGDFNEKLPIAINAQGYSRIVAVGTRLGNKLADNLPEPITLLAGANVVEEVPNIVHQLIDGLELETNNPNNRLSGIRLTAIYHESVSGQPCCRQLLPLCPPKNAPHYHHPPLLNLQPEVFFLI